MGVSDDEADASLKRESRAILGPVINNTGANFVPMDVSTLGQGIPNAELDLEEGEIPTTPAAGTAESKRERQRREWGE